MLPSHHLINIPLPLQIPLVVMEGQAEEVVLAISGNAVVEVVDHPIASCVEMMDIMQIYVLSCLTMQTNLPIQLQAWRKLFIQI